jgi:hypothetical protein
MERDWRPLYLQEAGNGFSLALLPKEEGQGISLEICVGMRESL